MLWKLDVEADGEVGGGGGLSSVWIEGELSCVIGQKIERPRKKYFFFNKLCAFRILVPNLKTINLTFGSLSPILYVKYDLNFGRFFDFILSWS